MSTPTAPARIVIGIFLTVLVMAGAGRNLGIPIGTAPLPLHAGASTGQALSGAWVRTGGPIGGLGYDIRVQPDNPDIMYVTDAFAGVFKSIDGGNSWFPLNSGIEMRTGPSNDAIPVYSLSIDPNNFNTLWIGMLGMRGVYRSTDAGATWAKRDTGIIENEGLAIRGVGVKPGDSNTVFAAGEVRSPTWNHGVELIGRLFDKSQGVIYRSTNAGQSWQEVWRGDCLARYLLFDPTSPNTMYASTGIFDREGKNSDPASNTAGCVGVLKSVDGGSTWTTINNGLGNLYVGSLALNPANPQMLLAGTGNIAYPAGDGIYRTTDGGATWAKVGAENVIIMSVEYSTTTPTIAYALADSSAGLFMSSDSGATWTQAAARWGPAGIRAGQPIDAQLDPRDPQRLFVNNYGGGNYMTADGGLTWTTASTGYSGADVPDVAVDPTDPARVYAMVRTGPFVSVDAGGSWRGINQSPRGITEGGALAVSPSDPNVLLMADGGQGLTFRSTNRGESWTLVSNLFGELMALPVTMGQQAVQGVRTFAFAPSDPSKVYAGFGIKFCAVEVEPTLCGLPVIASIFTSSDGGVTWDRHSGVAGNRTVSRIVVDRQNASKAWAATLGGGVFVTTDGGDTWTASNNGLTSLSVWSLAMAPGNAGVLFAGTSRAGVFKSTDGGATWTSSSSGMSAAEPIPSIVVSATDPNVVYAGSRASGLFVSTNGGASWTLNNAGLRQRAIQALTLSADGTALYAATQGEGVYRLGTPSVAARVRIPATRVPVSRAPAAPTTSDLVATASGSGVVLTWKAPRGVRPQRYAISGGTTPQASTLPVILTPDASTSYTIPAMPSGTYYFNVSAVLADGVTPSAEAARVAVNGSTAAVGAPSGATATADGQDVTVAWTPGQGNPTAYYVEVGSAPGRSDLATLTSIEPTLTYRAGAAMYYLRVRAVSGGAISAPSNEVSIRVNPASCASSPLAPLLLPVSTTNGETTISWLATEGPAAVSYSVHGTGPAGPVTIAEPGAGTSLTTALAPGTYAIRVTAVSACGNSAASNEVTFAQTDPAAALRRHIR